MPMGILPLTLAANAKQPTLTNSRSGKISHMGMYPCVTRHTLCMNIYVNRY